MIEKSVSHECVFSKCLPHGYSVHRGRALIVTTHEGQVPLLPCPPGQSASSKNMQSRLQPLVPTLENCRPPCQAVRLWISASLGDALMQCMQRGGGWNVIYASPGPCGACPSQLPRCPLDPLLQERSTTIFGCRSLFVDHYLSTTICHLMCNLCFPFLSHVLQISIYQDCSRRRCSRRKVLTLLHRMLPSSFSSKDFILFGVHKSLTKLRY